MHITAQLERLTLFTYPTIVAVLAWLFLGESLTRKILIALLLSYAGLGMLYLEERTFSGSENVGLGVGLVLGSALSYSLYVILAKPLIGRLGSNLFTSLAMLGSTVFVGIHYGLLNEVNAVDFSSLSGRVWLYCALLAFFCTVLPSYMIMAAIARIGATRTTLLGTVGPLFTIVLAVFLIGEPFGWVQLGGMLLVLLGVGLVSIKEKKNPETTRLKT